MVITTDRMTWLSGLMSVTWWTSGDKTLFAKCVDKTTYYELYVDGLVVELKPFQFYNEGSYYLFVYTVIVWELDAVFAL